MSYYNEYEPDAVEWEIAEEEVNQMTAQEVVYNLWDRQKDEYICIKSEQQARKDLEEKIFYENQEREIYHEKDI